MSRTPVKSLISTFESLDNPIKQALADIKQPLLLCLSTLALAEDFASIPSLSAEHIVAALEAADVSISRPRVNGALSRAGDSVSRKIVSDEIYYSLMTAGRRKVEPLFNIGPIQISYVEAGTPRTARIHLSEILLGFNGIIKIFDPYYGLRSFESLAEIPKKCNVEFLTSRTNENPTKLAGPIQDFKQEFPNVKIKVLSPASAPHDRYILTGNSLLLLGHGIKDIGNRDSFIVNISKSYAKDLIFEIESSFDTLWGIASSL